MQTCCRPSLSRSMLLACALMTSAAAQPSSGHAPFEKIQLTPDYHSEGACLGDFNQDGVTDVASGPFWWEGPDFSVRRTIYPPVVWPVIGYSNHFFSFAMDVSGDGWDDVVTLGFPGQAAHWYENPQQPAGTWVQHLLFANVGAESPMVHQLVPGGLPEIICASMTGLGYLSPDPASVFSPWIFRPIAPSPVPLTFLHGLGAGDVNGDGRTDVLTGLGWLEQPASLVGNPPWPAHPYGFGVVAGAQMFADDIDGDGDNDIVSSIDAHGWGLSWFEQVAAGGGIAFNEHLILPPFATPGAVQFSQLHALDMVDVDGDGLRDIVTGKTYLAHNGTDPGAFEPAVVYWFELDRTGGVVTFTPHLVDDDSGVGRQVVARDVDGDLRPDIVTGNKKGVFVFRRCNLWSDVDQLPIQVGGTQQLTLEVGPAHANRAYWLFGSASGTDPGLSYAGLHLALNPDAYSWQAINATNGAVLSGFSGTLDATGAAQAAFNLPPGLALTGPVILHHAAVVWDAQGPARTTGPVRLTLL